MSKLNSNKAQKSILKVESHENLSDKDQDSSSDWGNDQNDSSSETSESSSSCSKES